MNKKKFQKQMKILQIEDSNASNKQENESPRDVLFMALIQDENLEDRGKSSVKGTRESTSKPSRKWTYNGIYVPPPKYEAEESSSCIKEPPKSKKNT